MPRYTAETLADVLNNADDSESLDNYNQAIVMAGELKERHPAELYLALREHYTAEQLTSFAMPYSSQKDNEDWRGMPIAGNQVPIWDWNESLDNITGEKIKWQWYRRYVERLHAGKRFADIHDILKMCQSPDKYDLSNINTVINVEGPMDRNGKVEIIRLDARMITPSDRKSFISLYNTRLTALANGYRKAMAIHIVWSAIEQAPEFKDKVRVDWNWANPQIPSEGLAKNRAPLTVAAVMPDGKTGVWEVFSIARFIKLDVEGAIKAGATWKHLIESKFKIPDDRANAGQGETEEAKKRKSRIKVDAMAPILNEMVAFFDNDDAVTAFKALRVKLKDDVKADVDYNIVETARLLDKLITDEMEKNHRKVKKVGQEREEAELKERAERLAARENGNSTPKPQLPKPTLVIDQPTPDKPKPGSRKPKVL